MARTDDDESVVSAASVPSVTSGSRFPIPNNFDLLRLVAAVQVVYFHAQFHLHNQVGGLTDPLRWILGPLSGVPIFFIISGFLVSASFERHRGYNTYARNRIVRIYPALCVCLAITLAILGLAGYLGRKALTPGFFGWIVAQLTIGQSFHLPAFHSYATGIPNGSLWTISVEVLFYIGLPVLYLLFINRKSRRTSNLLLSALLGGSFLLAIAIAWIDPSGQIAATKALLETPAPYLYLFLIGLLCQRNFDLIAPWVVGKVLFWAIAYYALVSAMSAHTCTVALGWCPNQSSVPDAAVSLLSQLVLAGLIFSVAFSARTLSVRLLRGTDVSYGTYLFHMVLINVLVDVGIGQHLWLTPAIILSSLGLGWLSWRFIELPALRHWKTGPSPTNALGRSSRR